MLITKREAKQASKKLLSVLLAVVMVMTTISVCFATIASAVGGNATEAQWAALVNALKNDTVKGAEFSGTQNNYEVDDPDGKILAAVEAYYAVFNAMSNKTPTNQTPSNGSSDISKTGESSDTKRTINQLNTAIKNELSSRMGADYDTYGVKNFLDGLLCGASVDAGTTSQEVSADKTNNTDKPATGLDAIPAITLKVKLGSAVTGYTLEELKSLTDGVVAEKTFTVTHTNTNYDYAYDFTDGGRCGDDTFKHTYYYYYNVNANVTAVDGDKQDVSVITAAAATLETYTDYFGKDMDALVDTESATLTTVSSAVSTAKQSVVNAFGASVFTHFFSSYAVDTLVSDITIAKEIQNVGPYAIALMKAVEAGYEDIIEDKAALTTLLSEIDANLKVYNNASLSAKTYINNNGYDAAAVASLRAGVVRAIDLIELRELIEKVVVDLLVYSQYDEGDIDEGTVTNVTITTAYSKLESYETQLRKYNVADIDEISGTANFLGTITDAKNQLSYLGAVAGYNEEFANKYADFAANIFSVTDANGDLDTLRDALMSYDGWYTGLKNLIDEMRTELGDELAEMLFDDLNDVMTERIDNAYLALNTIVEAQINAAYDLFTAYVNSYGEKVNMASVSEYRAMKNSIGLIDVAAYNLLKGTAHFDISDEAVAKYDAMQKQFPQYEEFLNSHGFATYEQNFIPDIVRPEDEADGHGAHIGDYTVTDADIENIITLLEKLLADEDIKALLGNLINKDEDGNPTGEPFALGALVEGLLNDVVFTDSLINTIIQFVYPLVAKEFAKVWAGLPETMTIEDVDTGIMGIKADVTADLSLYSVEDAIAAVGVFLAPSTLAKNLENAYGKNSGEYAQYTEVISVLKSATTKAVYNLNGEGDEDDTFINPWDDANLFENVYDEETGEQVFNDDGTPKQVYKLNWGVDEAENKREAFINAACAALSGLEPLLFGILTNRTQANANDTDGVPRGAKIGTGEGSAKVIINLDLVIDPITLVLKFNGNDGYDNALAPIFEALGLTDIPHGEDLTTTRKILEDGLFAMIDQLITKLDTNPITFLLEALPNLAYALEADLVAPLLGMLRTEISYYADAQYSVIGLINGSMPEAMKSTDPIIVDLGEMINLEDMGLDISSFSAIWDMLAGSVELLANLAAPNAGYIATLGELVWKDTNRSASTYTALQAGKAAHINANKADVLIYLLRYVLNALPGILDSMEDLELSDDIKAIIAKATANPDKTIAAIVELLNQVEYDTLKEYAWYVSELDEETVVGLTPAIQQYLGYDNDWTKTKADYIIGNVDNIIAAVMKMVGGEDAESFEISALLTELIGGLFTNKNITAIAKLLAKLDLNALLAGDEETETAAESEENSLDINALVAKFAGIDLASFAAYAELADDYNWGFEDGNKDGFVNALVALLEPLQPVIDFVLAGGDLALLDGDVTLVGYNGYDSAIVPILEALSATPAALEDGENVLAAIINALVARVESLNSVDAILDIIPGILYFIKSNGLTTAVRNLLQPVLVILETIDPIYALNLNELIGGLTKDLGFTLNLDDLSFEAIFDILPAFIDLDLSELEEIIDDVCEVIVGETYTSASSLIGENGKRGAYSDFFDKADLVTVLLSFALSWLQEGDNANDIVALIAGDDAEKAEEITKYINGAIVIINGIDPEYESIDWAYNFPDGFDEAIFESGIIIQPTINTITYPTNWTEDTAKYVAENLDEIVDEIIGLVDENYGSLADFIADKLTIYSTENVDAIVKVVADLLVDIDEVLVKTVGLVLDADIAALKAYKAPEGIDTAEEFAAALTEVLATIQPVVDWLLFGEDYAFFSKNGADLITIKGAEGYAYGLAPILEALGVAAPAKDEATVENVLNAVFARVDAVLADPVNEVFELLPNIIYFLNANGVSTSVKNLLAGVTGLTDVISEEFALEVDLMKIFNDLIKDLLPEDTAVTLDVENLDLESIFALVQELLGLDLTPIAGILVDLCVGQIVAYTSASGEYGFKMMYTDDFAKYDMLTIIASCLLQIIKLEANREAIVEMLGADVYEAILNVISLDVNVPVQGFDWALTDKADSNEAFSALLSSELYNSGKYGPLYTKEMANYIADNFGEFVDNIIYLLGIQIIEGQNVNTLKDLINDLLGGSLYNSDMVITIRDAIAGLVGTLEESLPAGAHIIEVLGRAGIADLKAVAAVEVPEFSDDRAQFVASLCDVLEPLYGALNWLLADEDLTFFVDEELNTVITLPGAEGYAYGLIPVLEVLDCKDILTPAEYYAAIENGDTDTVITAILNPLLNRVDEILADDPAQAILDMLPNLIYFINSNGVDTVVKNTLNAVYTLLNAIEPIAKVDLYELIGIDLAEIDFEWLFNKLLEIIKNATGYEFEALDANALVELTVGKLESYTSANGETAYKMVYADGASGDKAEMVTVVMRLLITFIMHENNQEMLVGVLKDAFNMSPDAEKYVRGVIGLYAEVAVDTYLGMDQALATTYYLFYGADLGVDNATGGYKDLNADWIKLLKKMGYEGPDDVSTSAKLIAGILGLDIFEDLISTEGIAPNGFIAFFQKIIELFNKIVEWFKNLFN